MKTSFFILLGFLVLTSVAFARLGETPEQLRARFGAPAASQPDFQVFSQGHAYPVGKILSFKADDWGISCTIINGVCEQITYDKMGEFSNEQITAILNNEAQGSKWTESTNWKTLVDGIVMPQFHVREWKRADGAYATKTGGQMTLTTPAYDKAVAAAKEQGNAATQKTPANL